MALGARRDNVLRLLVGQGARPVGVGLVLGLFGAAMTTRFLRGTLYGVSPTDPMTFGVVAAAFVLVALMAIVVPARRAARIEPTIALRSE
jgi:ABC-type antimicrobial peptide transport system permease subunit